MEERSQFYNLIFESLKSDFSPATKEFTKPVRPDNALDRSNEELKEHKWFLEIQEDRGQTWEASRCSKCNAYRENNSGVSDYGCPNKLYDSYEVGGKLFRFDYPVSIVRGWDQETRYQSYWAYGKCFYYGFVAPSPLMRVVSISDRMSVVRNKETRFLDFMETHPVSLEDYQYRINAPKEPEVIEVKVWKND